jgi:hypothetical protein
MKIIAFPVRVAFYNEALFQALPLRPHQAVAFEAVITLCREVGQSKPEKVMELAMDSVKPQLAFDLLSSLFFCRVDPARKYDCLLHTVFCLLAQNNSDNTYGQIGIKSASYLTNISIGILWWARMASVLMTKTLLASGPEIIPRLTTISNSFCYPTTQKPSLVTYQKLSTIQQEKLETHVECVHSL